MADDLTPEQHRHYLSLALTQAHSSPPKPTNFRVGALLLSPSSQTSPTGHPDPKVLVTGYTLECSGNTHAEQSCFIKLAETLNLPIPTTGVEVEGQLGPHLPEDTMLYTTMEPCNKRSVGNTPCVERILALRRRDGGLAIRKVVVGVSEPETFVGVNSGKRRLEEAGVEVLHVEGMEEDILRVATAGHEKGTKE